MKESFVDLQDANTLGNKKIQQYFGVRLPNAVYGNDPSMPLEQMTATPNGVQTKTSPILQDPWIVAGLSGGLLDKSRQQACESVGTGDQFEHLVSLTQNYDRQSRARCGWVYDNTRYQDGRGAYGISDGPLGDTSLKTGTKWYWNLDAAKQKYHTAMCNEVKHCADLDFGQYKGRCGWCASSGKAVPITAAGTVAYPFDPLTACSSASIVKSSGSCPVAPPPALQPPLAPGEPPPIVPPAQLCDPGSNNQLSRNCLLSKVKQVGCSEDGTLYQSLRSGSDLNYLDSLAQASAYSLYQKRAALGMDETALKSGKLTVSSALGEFQRVQTNASLNNESGLQYAARDLCYKAGSMQTFDFCTEITDAQQGPFGLDCIQKQFLRAGGQKTGTAYPSTSNISMWNSQNTWLDVKNKTQVYYNNTKSSDRATQENAMLQFYGIPLENKTKPKLGAIPGIEIFWFDLNLNIKNTDNIFLGRRIRGSLPFINGKNDLKGVINSTKVSMVFFTNLNAPTTKSVRFRVTSQDGFALHFNEPIGKKYEIGQWSEASFRQDANCLSALDLFPPTTFQNTVPWVLKPDQLNLLYGFYFQNAGGMYFKIEMQDFTTGSASSLTRARFFSNSLVGGGFQEATGVSNQAIYAAQAGGLDDCKCLGTGTPGGNRIYTQSECAQLGGFTVPVGTSLWMGDGMCAIPQGNILSPAGSWSYICRGLNNLQGKCEEPKSSPWTTVPNTMLNLTQEPYAPMISFQVYKEPQAFGADFNFADKRMGSYRMKWMTYTGTPTWVYKTEARKPLPFGLPIVRFRSDSSMRLVGRFKMYSFMTMTIAMTFNALPSNSVNSEEYITMLDPANSGRKIGIRVQGYGATNSAVIILYAEGGGDSPKTKDTGIRVEQGVPYLLALRVIRDNETDIYTVSGITVSAQKVSVLRTNPSEFTESGLLGFSDPRSFSNPDSTESRTMIVGNGNIDVAWIRMYDYYLDTANLAREVQNNWQHLGDD